MSEEEKKKTPETEDAPEADGGNEWRQKYLRALADLDNFRKRMERERRQMELYACEGLLRNILPVLDDLEAACAAEGDADQIRKGVELALRSLRKGLTERGLEAIEALDEPFDPRVHEAVGGMPDAERAPGTVVAELRRGYRLHDRVLRPSRVHVAVAPPGETEETASEDDDDSED